ncbi:uncharacterized protein LOC116849808 [Odontomachus brunneus]|uniref:uncharacterized protein LOC116849808 n=1 Tax=Odontomachus brunneus TaxID=486640 RepID=UPI0013F1E4C7|nr:uncharacterized protein LOC116849808 [Odontomachus brunneus]
MLNRKSSQKNYPQNRMRCHDSESTTCTTPQVYCNNETIIERNHLKLYKHRIDMLTVALENFRIQNEQLKQELDKYRENTVDNEVFPLRNHVKELTSQQQSQNFTWKIKSLKKTIAKLRKLNSTIENVYEKKLQRIVKNKNLEIKVLQLQFQERASDIFLSLCSEKQNELHNLVSSLEKRYKTLLTNADAAIESQREEYITKIAALEAELCHLRNNLRSKSEYM